MCGNQSSSRRSDETGGGSGADRDCGHIGEMGTVGSAQNGLRADVTSSTIERRQWVFRRRAHVMSLASSAAGG